MIFAHKFVHICDASGTTLFHVITACPPSRFVKLGFQPGSPHPNVLPLSLSKGLMGITAQTHEHLLRHVHLVCKIVSTTFMLQAFIGASPRLFELVFLHIVEEAYLRMWSTRPRDNQSTTNRAGSGRVHRKSWSKAPQQNQAYHVTVYPVVQRHCQHSQLSAHADSKLNRKQLYVNVSFVMVMMPHMW